MKSLETILNWVLKFLSPPLGIVGLYSYFFEVSNPLFLQVILLSFCLLLFCLGLWMSLGVYFRWESWRKRKGFLIDFEKHGVIGRIAYLVLGVLLIFMSFFFFYRIFILPFGKWACG